MLYLSLLVKLSIKRWRTGFAMIPRSTKLLISLHLFMSRHLSEEHKQRLSENRKGKNNPFYGKKHTKETREKMSKALRGKNHPLYGKHLSDETKKKLSDLNKGENGPFYGKKHTKESREKISKANKGKGVGKNNSNWNPNLTSEERWSKKGSNTTKALRRAVYKRDKHTCQCCGIKEVPIEAHHMENFSDNLHLRLLVDNLITLCKNCHLQFHRICGFHHTTTKQTKEFIYNYQILILAHILHYFTVKI